MTKHWSFAFSFVLCIKAIIYVKLNKKKMMLNIGVDRGSGKLPEEVTCILRDK